VAAFLEVTEGTSKGRKIELKVGQAVTVGRSSAIAAFPEDSHMSDLHLVIAFSNGSVKLKNLSKTNGTLVNGELVDTSLLKEGDRVQAGSTFFTVVMPPASPYPAQFRAGGWGFEMVPAGWDAVEGFGLRLAGQPRFKASVSAVEEPLPEGQTFAAYVETQVTLARGRFPKIEVQGPSPVEVRGASEARAITILTPAPDGERIMQRQLYALAAGVAGVFTATFLESQVSEVRNAIAEILRGVSYHQEQK
jgi:hypothetical protein